MTKQILNRIRMRYGPFELNRVLVLFRYASFAVTSLFFLIGGTAHSSGRKMFIVCCIGISSVMLNHLYSHYLSNARFVVPLLMIETVFNAFLLIPSGGLASPYIWYSLNTILVGAVALKRKLYCWVNLLIYLFSSIWVFSRFMGVKTILTLQTESNLLISLVLITGAVQLLASYNRKIEEKNSTLEKKNHELLLANNQISKSMSATMELYLAIHLLSAQENQNNLTNIILRYILRITKSETVFFVKNGNDRQPIIETSIQSDTNEINRLRLGLSEHFKEVSSMNAIDYFKLDNKSWMVAPVKCHFEIYGVIGVEVTHSSDNQEHQEREKQLIFLSELSTIVLEKAELEQINKRLLINEEQNRIANEIHDGVLQKLFSISCGIYGLTKRFGSMNARKAETELTIIQSSLNSAMSDLRSTIYGYSWKKNGVNDFIQDIQRMIDSIKRFHEVEIDFKPKDNYELLSTDHKTAFYRIICEGIGNALRHGKAGHIAIELAVGIRDVVLQITDNGTGFDINGTEKANDMGMGIKNMQLLTQSLKGSIRINSTLGKGTSINIKVPVDLKTGIYKEDIV